MARMNAMASVKREDYYFDMSIPFSRRRDTYARKMLLLTLFKGEEYASRWAEANMPYELRAMSRR
jgi:hypothetical protein